jgi:signal transduction histidine kinase
MAESGSSAPVSGIVRLPARQPFSALELHAAAIGSIAAAVLFFGWGLDIEFLRSVVPGFPTMRPGAALALMLLSLSCILSLRESPRARMLSSLVAGAAMLWVVWLVARNWGAELYGTTGGAPPLQATMAALILGAAAMLIVNLAPRYGLLAAALVIAGAIPALYRCLALLLFWGQPPASGSLFSSMALHTAVLVVWFMACILMHPRLAFADAIFQRSLRGRVLRRALPIIIALPVLAGALCLIMVQAAGWTAEALFALTAALGVAEGAALIWWLSHMLSAWQRDANEHVAQLARANEALDQYASSAAHDLRAPSRHVLIFGELMQEAVSRGDHEAAARFGAKMHDAAKQLPPMIDGMLEYARSGFTKVTPGRHALSELVQSASSMMEEDLKTARARITVEQDPRIWCDGKLLVTVFQNLFANSLSHGRKARALDIGVSAVSMDGSWEVTVTDNGPGFDPAFAAVAFNPLARGMKRAGEGAGIGLATCRTIIASHNGQIRINETYRGGAQIVFTLPGEPGPAGQAQASPTP